MKIKIRNCVFGFRCAQNWDEMKETSREGVRFCKECEKDVHFVTEEDGLLMALSENLCIAMKPPKNPEVPVEEYPDLITKYALDSNKGYGAKKHMDGIKEHGITIWHRRSFGICKNYV